MFKLDPLPYSFDALEPYIDAQTMEIHYTKHHQTYVSNLNNTLKEYPELQNKTLYSLLQNLDQLPVSAKNSVRNNGGGHYNHTLFWMMMDNRGGKMVEGSLLAALKNRYSTIDQFKNLFEAAAKTRFGSGWAWLVVDKDGELNIVSTANQDSPVTDGNTVVLGLDVWEHAYYLSYQNRRPDYISAWWNVVNWEFAEENYKQALKI